MIEKIRDYKIISNIGEGGPVRRNFTFCFEGE